MLKINRPMSDLLKNFPYVEILLVRNSSLDVSDISLHESLQLLRILSGSYAVLAIKDKSINQGLYDAVVPVIREKFVIVGYAKFERREIVIQKDG